MLFDENRCFDVGQHNKNPGAAEHQTLDIRSCNPQTIFAGTATSIIFGYARFKSVAQLYIHALSLTGNRTQGKLPYKRHFSNLNSSRYLLSMIALNPSCRKKRNI